MTYGVDVFAYQDFRNFLKDFYQERRKRDRKFSIRFFARRAGLRSQNYLKVVMDGRRSLTARNLPKFIKGLGLDASQAEYFETLVNLNQARDITEQKEHYSRLTHLQKKKAALTLAGEQLEFFNTCHNVIIFEMACQEGFNPDPEKIAKKLGITTAQAFDSINLMTRLGILKPTETGSLIPVASQLSSPESVPNEQLKKLHLSFIEKGIHALKHDRHEDREMRSLTIGLTKEQLPAFKAKLRDFQRELNTLFSTGKADDIYQINWQFFKLTSSSREE